MHTPMMAQSRRERSQRKVLPVIPISRQWERTAEAVQHDSRWWGGGDKKDGAPKAHLFMKKFVEVFVWT